MSGQVDRRSCIYCPVTCFFKHCGKNPEQIYSPKFFSIQYSVDSRLIVVSDSLEFLFLSGKLQLCTRGTAAPHSPPPAPGSPRPAPCFCELDYFRSCMSVKSRSACPLWRVDFTEQNALGVHPRRHISQAPFFSKTLS